MKYDTKSRNRLQEWLEERNISAYKFCHMINGTQPNVWLWVTGKSRPSYKYASAIQQITEGDVAIEGWYELCEPTKEPKNSNHKPNTTKHHERTLKGKRASKPRKQVA
jgi:hypothetical protein